MTTTISKNLSDFLSGASDFNRRIGMKLRAREPRALEWAARVNLRHWHEIGWGCGPGCLDGIKYVPDPDARSWSDSGH